MFHICRTCLQHIPDANYVSLSSSSRSTELKSQLALCVPEMTIGLVTLAEPVMCTLCVNALYSAYTFKTRCLETEQRIQDYLQKRHIGINLLEVVQDLDFALPNQPQNTREFDFTKTSTTDIHVKEEFTVLDDNLEMAINKCEQENQLNNECHQQDITTPSLAIRQKELEDLLQQRSRLPRYGVERPHKCDKCPFSSSDRSTLTKHKATHSDERPFACTLCTYRTKRKDALTLHLKRHRAIKPNICPQCRYSAVTKQCLRRHIMVAHLEMRPYKCDQCHLSFADQGTLTKHMLTHTDAKPYKCKMCDFSTKRKYTLANHIKSHGKGPMKISFKEKTNRRDKLYNMAVLTGIFDHMAVIIGSNFKQKMQAYISLEKNVAHEKGLDVVKL